MTLFFNQPWDFALLGGWGSHDGRISIRGFHNHGEGRFFVGRTSMAYRWYVIQTAYLHGMILQVEGPIFQLGSISKP